MISRPAALPFSRALGACSSLLVALFLLLTAAAIPSANADKTETWVEVRSPNFRVVSNSGEKEARRIAAEFEKIRAVFGQALPGLATHASPVVTVLAVKDEKSLRELLPEYWATKGHTHPSGLFHFGLDKYYAVVRTDTTGEGGYQTIYHEYFHSISMPYHPNLPLWLAEGLAEFYGHTQIDVNVVKLGQADPGDLQLLREQPLLPLDTLFRVDHASPYYNERNRATIFYAESWALSHYFMLGGKGAHRPQLVDYLKRLDNGVPQDQAAREAFGDLAELEKQLRRYVREETYYRLVTGMPTGITEKGFQARPLAAAESAAVRGDWFACRLRPLEAEPLLEEALRLDPKSPQAHESMGFLNFMQGKREEAARRFSEAIALDSHSYLVYYYRAMLNRSGFLDETSLDQTENDLRRATELNPNFAVAYGVLATFEARNPEELPEALELAKKALSLEPGNVAVQLNYATVLMLAGHLPEAQSMGLRAQQAAKSPEERAQVTQFLASLEQYRSMMASGGRVAQAAPEASFTAQPSETTSEEPPPEAPPSVETPQGASGSATPPPGTAEGEITAVSCRKPTMSLEIESGGHPLHLHARDLTQIEFLGEDWTPPDHFDPCRDLKGLRARVRFTPVQQKAYTGEIVSIEIRRGASP